MSWLSLGLGLVVSISSLGLYTLQSRKKDALALARFRVSSQYFPVLDCVPYSYARRLSWLSLGLGLAVSISQFLIVYHTVTQEGFPGSR